MKGIIRGGQEFIISNLTHMKVGYSIEIESESGEILFESMKVSINNKKEFRLMQKRLIEIKSELGLDSETTSLNLIVGKEVDLFKKDGELKVKWKFDNWFYHGGYGDAGALNTYANAGSILNYHIYRYVFRRN